MILNRLKTPRKSITSIQREGQARSPTKSEGDSAANLIDGADGEQSLSLATDRVERILTLIKSQNVAIYIIRSSLVAIQLPLARDGHGCPKLNAQRL